jgi:hypothetical protein
MEAQMAVSTSTITANVASLQCRIDRRLPGTNPLIFRASTYCRVLPKPVAGSHEPTGRS